MTENFIQAWMKNDNGTLATYLRDGNAYDADLVKGREALAESLGLWMLYAIEKDDQRLFQESFQLLEELFLEKDGFVYWKLNESGESEVYTNALADDLRIIDALLVAKEKWGQDQYEKTAILMSQYVNEFSTNRSILTDFYERLEQYSSSSITLSYIDISVIEKMRKGQLLDEQLFERTKAVLKNAPLKKGFYPKSYHVIKQSYAYDAEVNMVDQALTAYHQARMGIVSSEFLDFIKKEILKQGVIYGRYHLKTRKPAVEYESPAVYGILIMYCLEIKEEDLAKTIYDRMVLFRNNDDDDPYYGGYSISKEGNTHIFDNLVPLLAETKLIHFLESDR